MPRPLPVTRRPAAVAAAALVAGLLGAAPGPADAAGAAGARVDVVVQLRSAPGAVASAAADHAGRYGARVRHVYRHAVTGYAASVPASLLDDLRRDPAVAVVEADTTVRAFGVPWHLDRIDQPYLPLDGRPYSSAGRGSGVTAYVVDTGISYAHPELGGRARPGYDVTGGDGSDCNGHGTHVAGLLGGATYGAAGSVRLVSVRVLDCLGIGLTSGIVAGLDWIVADHTPGALAVANLSLGGAPSSALDTAVRSVVADGVPVAVAAGGSAGDACNFSPARVPEAMTTGATDASDRALVWTNTGACVDWYAPGANMTSAWPGGGTRTMSGSSLSSPLTAAAAAMLLHSNPTGTPAWVQWTIRSSTTKDVVQPATLPNNDMLHVGTSSS